MTIQERVRAVRNSLGLNQKQFGNSLQIQQGAVSHIERGGTVTEKNINAICRQYGVSEVWLRTGEGEMFADEAEVRNTYKEFLRTFDKLCPAMQNHLHLIAESLLSLQEKLALADVAAKLGGVQTLLPEEDGLGAALEAISDELTV